MIKPTHAKSRASNLTPASRSFHLFWGFIWMAAILLLSGCNLPFTLQGSGSRTNQVEKAQVILTAYSLKPLAEGERIELVIVDEVTGIPYHQERIPMTMMQNGAYGAVTEAPIGTVLTYVFHKVNPAGSRTLETGADLHPIRYRMYLVYAPGVVIETIAGWEDNLPDTHSPAQVSGTILSSSNGEPLSDLLVTAGGLQTLTDADGHFRLYPLTPGKHTLTAISVTGSSQPTQAKVETAAGKVTPVELSMAPSLWREVTFKLRAPEDTIPGAPVRLAGNLAQMGNTFMELGGGISGDAKQMPVLTAVDGNRYSLTMLLPAGIDIRYKYTLGDGLWNAEHERDQSFVTHQLILPPDGQNLVIEDTVVSWRSSETETIWFEASVPDYTPANETIGIQFSIAEWMPALPMFKIRENTWAFPLISPHNFSGDIPYRYCRSTPCIGDGQAGVESLSAPRSTTTIFQEPQLISGQVNAWSYLTPPNGGLPQFEPVPAQKANFTFGLSLTPYQNGRWQTEINAALADRSAPYNTVILSPAWVTATQPGPNLFQLSVAESPRRYQLVNQIETAHQAGKAVGLFPQVLTLDNPLKWWQSLPTAQESTWQQWLTEVEDLYYQYANLAAETDAEILILGGDWLQPALPTGENFSTYNQPGNIESLWAGIIQGVRDRYPGQLGWALTLDTAEDPPAFLSELDLLLLQWDLPLEAGLSPADMQTRIGGTLDEIAQPLSEDLGKPLILLIAIPSISGFDQDCIPSPNDEGVCIDLSALKLGPSVENPTTADLPGQTAAYYALLNAVATREWISGLLAQGTFPGLALHDSSASIYGKPAEILFQNWGNHVLGK